MQAKSLLFCPILCDPVDSSQPGSPVRGTFQARILEWVAMPYPRGSSPPRDGTASLKSLALAGRFFTASCHLGSPLTHLILPQNQSVCV